MISHKDRAVVKKALAKVYERLAGRELELNEEEEWIQFCHEILTNAGYFHNCFYCDFWQEDDTCGYYKRVPPPHIIMNGCNKFSHVKKQDRKS